MANVKVLFDIKPLVQELMRTDLKSCFKNIAKDSALLNKVAEIEKLWRQILNKIDLLGKRIASEGISSSMGIEAKAIADDCCRLGTIAGPLLVEGGSFVPGPVGIVCSLALAIADFAVGNFLGGFMNLLGAIPFAKGATKAAGPIIENIVKSVHANKEIMKFVKQSSHVYKPTTKPYLKGTKEETKGLFEKYVKDGHYVEASKAAEPPVTKMKTVGDVPAQTYNNGSRMTKGQTANNGKLDSGYNKDTIQEARKELTNYSIYPWKYSIIPKGGI